MIKQFEEFINESFKTKDFVIVDAWDNASAKTYLMIMNDYADAMIETDYGNYFIIPRLDAINLNDRRDGINMKIYNIPSKYKTLDDIESVLKSGVLNVEDLEILD